MLDADEILSKEDHALIKELTKSKEYDAYTFVQVSYTNDQKMLGFKMLQRKNPEAREFIGFIDCNIIRLFRNNKGTKFTNPVHESVDATIKDKTRIQKTAIILHHYQFEKGERVNKYKQINYLKIYEEKIDEFENKSKVFRDMAIINHSFKEDYPKAIQFYKKSLLLNPNNIKTYLGLAIALLKNKQIEEATAIISEAEKMAPQNQDIRKLKQDILQIKQLSN